MELQLRNRSARAKGAERRMSGVDKMAAQDFRSFGRVQSELKWMVCWGSYASCSGEGLAQISGPLPLSRDHTTQMFNTLCRSCFLQASVIVDEGFNHCTALPKAASLEEFGAVREAMAWRRATGQRAWGLKEDVPASLNTSHIRSPEP